MNTRKNRAFYRQNEDTIKPILLWTKRIIWLGIGIALMFIVIFRALVIMSDRPCVTATPAYAQQIGCDK